ncbi:disulfide bond formation protein B [Sphingosinicella xenopeptidilytica]|uniref:Disulfide bond formation protein B n=1 Tax=Sphingosinicella xenopeptidilytica TaxID=364098 RepID=A0ABW3BYG1_SPHXN
MLTALSNLLLNRRLVGAVVLAIVLFTLALDVTGLVHPCPYCRMQRFALGVISIVLLFRFYNALLSRYIVAVVGMMGLVVGIMQNFNHLKKMNKGEFDWSALSIGHPWVLSGLAILTLVWLFFLVFDLDKSPSRKL